MPANKILISLIVSICSILILNSCDSGSQQNGASQIQDNIQSGLTDEYVVFQSFIDPAIQVKGKGKKNKKTNKREGDFVFTYQIEGNPLARKCRYKDGLLIGEMIDYFPSGEIASVRYFEEEVPSEPPITTKADIEMYSGGDGESSDFIACYESSDTIYIPTNTGEWKFYYEYGAIQSTVNYLHGVLHGTETTFFGNDDRIESFKNYKNGVLHGAEKTFDFDGNVLSSFNYIEGTMEGEQYCLHGNGNLYWKSIYKNGQAIYNEGPFTIGGREIMEETLVNGKKNGKCTYYFLNDSIRQVKYYKDDVLHGKSIEYYENGKIMRTSNYVDGLIDGMSKTYAEDGKIIKEMPYKQGKCHGMAWIYHINPPHAFVGNEIYVEGRIQNPSPSESSSISDGGKCAWCGMGFYSGGYCSICGAASGDKTWETYSKLPTCVVCYGMGTYRNKLGMSLNCGMCNGTGVQIR